MSAKTSSVATESVKNPGFWQRRLIAPIIKQLTQGITPQKISFTLAVGSACSLFPFLGFTALLNLGVGILLKLNHPILQTLNQLLTPIHLLLLLVYVRTGEWIWGADESLFSITEVVRQFADLSFFDFLQKFGWAGVHAFTAWSMSIPLIFVAVYYPLQPIIEKLAANRKTTSAP